MAGLHYASFLSIVLILEAHYVYASFNFQIPFISPLFGTNACKENICGRGNCVVSNNTVFGFECECEQGWRQARDEDDDEGFNFLPCVVPNCTLNYTCADTAPPAPYTNRRSNMSFWDPCFWTNCGGGSCNKTSAFTHTCECEEGYFNLFNHTAFPCYRQCAFGADCPNFGLSFPNSSASPHNPSSTLSETNSRAASLISGVEFAWFYTLVMSVALLLWNQA